MHRTDRLDRFMHRVAALGLCVLALAACTTSARSTGTDAQHTVQTWCRLAEFPTKRTDEQIEVQGSSVTREIVVSFQVDREELQRWIAASPGLQDAQLSAAGDVTLYTITPKDAAYCLARINPATGVVYLKTYWS